MIESNVFSTSINHLQINFINKVINSTMPVDAGNSLYWNTLYENYAAVMYGNILNITKDKRNAEIIFIIAFTKLKTDYQIIPEYCKLVNF